MKRPAAAALLTCLMLLTTTFAQSSVQSTSQLSGAEKNKAITVLVGRVKAGEEAIAAKQARVSTLEEQVAEMERSKQNLSDAYKAALLELGELRGEVKNLRAAVTDLKTNLEEVKGERDVAQSKVKDLKSENRLMKLYITVRTIGDIVSIFR